MGAQTWEESRYGCKGQYKGTGHLIERSEDFDYSESSELSESSKMASAFPIIT